MSRGKAFKRKVRAWTRKANHGRKPNKGRRRRMLRYKEIFGKSLRDGVRHDARSQLKVADGCPDA